MVDLDDTWLPIATAPKDGTKVKVLYGGEEHIDSYIGPENDPETHNELWGLTPWLGEDPTHWKLIIDDRKEKMDTFDFTEALKKLKSGKHVSRKDWKYYWLESHNNHIIRVSEDLDMYNPDTNKSRYTPTEEDKLAKDWKIDIRMSK